MAKLILSVDGQVLKEFTLSKERTLIGRKPHNDIQIDNLAVSGEHAAIITILNDSFIEDLGSTNGTMVNGKPIKKHFLQNNDVVELGKHKLKYFNDAPTAATAADFEKTMIIRNPAKAAPPPPKAEDLGDTHTNLKPLAAEIPKSTEPTRPIHEPKPAPKAAPEAKAPEKAPEQKAPEFKMPEFRPPDFKAPAANGKGLSSDALFGEIEGVINTALNYNAGRALSDSQRSQELRRAFGARVAATVESDRAAYIAAET